MFFIDNVILCLTFCFCGTFQVVGRYSIFTEGPSKSLRTGKIVITFMLGLCLLGVTIVAKNDYCNSIDIARSAIAILLLLWTTMSILL